MNGVSTHWFVNLFERQAVGDFGGSFSRSIRLGLIVMVVTLIVSVSAGMAFRQKFRGATFLFYLAIASLIVPSILISLGVGLMFNILKWDTDWYSSALGAHLTWTLPFGLLIMFAVFNRFNKAYEEAGPRPGRHARADLPLRGAADHRTEPDRRGAVRFHAVL